MGNLQRFSIYAGKVEVMFLSGLISEALIVDVLFFWSLSGAANQVEHDEPPRVKRNRGPKPKIMYDGTLKWLKSAGFLVEYKPKLFTVGIVS